MHLLFAILFLWSFGFAELAVSPQELDLSLSEHIHYHEKEKNRVGHIYIGGHETQISQGTYLYVKKALEYFQKELKPIFVILELDTPGGQVFPAQKISDELKNFDINYGIPVIALINNWAISAGAMLAYSSRYIAVVKDGSMGAAQPVSQSGEKTSEKVNSAIRADFANRASFFDRNPLLAEAMVDADLILVLREGKIVELSDNKDILKTDRVITRKGKLLTLNSKELYDLGVADMRLMPAKLVPITTQQKEVGEWSFDQSLLATYPFFSKIPNAVVKSYQMDWKTQFFSFLASPLVTSILFLGLLLGAYIEISTPGFGIAGGVALVCLALIVLSSFALQAAGWLELIILGVGIALILVEIFLIPGFGVTGILGIILALAGLFAMLLPGLRDIKFDFDTNTLNAAGEFILHRIAYLAAAIVIGVVVIAILARFIVPRLAIFSPLVLRGEQEAGLGYVSGMKKEELPDIGSVGVVVSPLRTAGKVEIKEQIYDAVSSGKFIPKGEKIKVISIQGSKLIVEEEA